MQLKNLIGIFSRLSLVVSLSLLASCAHHRSGSYVFRDGKWQFVAARVGILTPDAEINESSFNSQYAGKFIWPVPSSFKVSSHFGPRKGRHHDGIDISAPTGASILAAADGVVLFVGRGRGYGKMIIVKHRDNHHTIYAHNSKNIVRKGQNVSQGEVIGKVGRTGRSTGPHLHFEIRQNNIVHNPAWYIARQKDPIIADE